VKRIGDQVSGELKRFGPSGTMPRLVEVWPAAVGQTIARNAWPARVARDGTLHVATSSSSWAFELAQLEADIMRRLRDAAGASAPRSLRFAVGKLPELGADEASADPRREVLEPTDEERAEAAAIAAAIDDEELRKLVAKAAAQSLARGR
jgi:hypothetical protein